MYRLFVLVPIVAWGFLCGFESNASGAEDLLPPGDKTPILRIESGGPRSNVNSLAFSPDGRYLYAAGWDKLVQVWNLNNEGRYEYNSAAGLRVPTGSGNYGGLNAMALSEDGLWLAVAGLGHARDLSGERNTGWIVPSGMRTEAALFDEGMIYVFNLQTRDATLLRGHKGPVQALTFVNGRPMVNQNPIPPELVSIAEEPVEDQLTKPEIRLWSVEQTTTLATLTTFPNQTGDQQVALPGLRGFRPGVTAWRTGTDSHQVEVALAWGDNRFRVWDVRSGKIADGAGGDVMLTVLPLSKEPKRILTGAHGAIGVWSLPLFSPGQLKPQTFDLAEIPEVNNKQFHLPRASAIIRGSDGVPESVGMIVTRHLTDDQGRPIGRAKYRLLILSAVPLVKTMREIELWEGPIRQPSLAVTNDGQTIAVAGNPQNEIHLLRTKNLIAGDPPKPEIISSLGVMFRDAAFVRDGERWGIKLSQTPRDKSGKFPAETLVLDIATRRVDKASDKWRLSEADSTGWSSNLAQNGAFTVERPGMPVLALKLEKDYEPQVTAFCAASEICPIPLVAVASHLRGQPLLEIFDGDTGSPLRWCEAHTERIRSLSFSEDGRMLLSVADDRTASIWTVADLVDRVLKKRGRIPDLVVRMRENELVVFNAGSSELQKSDAILSLSSNAKTAKPTTSKEFYAFVLGCKPGDQVNLTVRRTGVIKVIACPVDQAIDESKQLFSLFVAPSDRENEWEWIGWHPLGNFDFRGDRVEQQLGWHFNTGDPLQPAAFATVAEYRDKFVSPDLLQSLISKQKLEVAELPAAIPQIKLGLRYKTNDRLGEDRDAERLLIKSRDVFLIADVADRRIRVLNVSVDSGPPIKFTQDVHQDWFADFSGINWERGPHQLEVKLTTPDGETVRSQLAQFQPRPPAILWEQSWDKVVSTNTVEVKAEVTPTNEPTHVELKVYPPGKAAQLVRAWDFSPTDNAIQIAAEVELESGESLLRLEAWNTSHKHPTEKFESNYKIVPITRANPTNVVRISALAVSVEQADSKVPLVPTDQHVYHTSSPLVWITGIVESSIPVEKLEFTVGEDHQDLKGFQPGKQTKYSIEKQLTLQPGRREVVTIRTMAGKSADVRRLELECVPALPSVASLKVLSEGVLRQLPSHVQREPLVYFSDYDDPRVIVKATLDGNLDQDCTGTFIVNDQPGEPLTIRPGQRELVTSLQLADGTSLIEFQIKVSGASEKSPPVKVEFRRPPVLGKPEADQQVSGVKIFNVSCDARSKLPLRNAILSVGTQRRKMRILKDPEEPGLWLLEFKGELALPHGDHQLQINATNDDGDSIVPAVHEVRVAEVASSPLLEILRAASTVSVDSIIEIEIKVKSNSPAKIELDVRCNEGKVDQLNQLVEHSGDGEPIKTPVQLAEGVNIVALTAFNKDGANEKQVFQISYVPPPIAVDIVSIDGETPDFFIRWAANKKELQLRNKMSKNLFPIQGQVFARESLAAKLPLRADIWVNSFKLPTVPVQIDPKNSKRATFVSNVALSRQEQNLIQVKIIGKEGPQPSELGKSGAMLVDCENAVRDQTLYLLLLGTGDPKLQEQQARKALAVTKIMRPGVWRSEHFSEIHVLNSMNDNIPYVQRRIATLQSNMDRKLKSRPEASGSSIVMILFQGQMTVGSNQFHLQTDTYPANRPPQLNELLSGRFLESQLNKTYGAHLLLLDLQQQSIATESIWSKAPHLGVLVSNWNGLVDRPVESHLISDLREQYPLLRELASTVEQKSLFFPGQLETIDRLQSHYALRFGAPK